MAAGMITFSISTWSMASKTNRMMTSKSNPGKMATVSGKRTPIRSRPSVTATTLPATAAGSQLALMMLDDRDHKPAPTAVAKKPANAMVVCGSRMTLKKPIRMIRAPKPPISKVVVKLLWLISAPRPQTVGEPPKVPASLLPPTCQYWATQAGS